MFYLMLPRIEKYILFKDTDQQFPSSSQSMAGNTSYIFFIFTPRRISSFQPIALDCTFFYFQENSNFPQSYVAGGKKGGGVHHYNTA